jgi:hypothetical protein
VEAAAARPVRSLSDRIGSFAVNPFAIVLVTGGIAVLAVATVGHDLVVVTCVVALLAGWSSAWSP